MSGFFQDYAIPLFVLATAAIGIGGYQLTATAGAFATRFKLSEGFMGAFFLGAITSLSGTVLTASTALHGFPNLAISNALGGIAGQTAFLVLADLSYRKANLEHAAASLPNMISAALLIAMLSITLTASFLPPVAFFGIHPISVLSFLAYLGGIKLVRSSTDHPMWHPKRTAETASSSKSKKNTKQSTSKIIFSLTVLSLVVAIAGYVLAESAESIIAKWGLEEVVVGAIFTALATSLPELCVSLSAVRQGALAMAVGNIIGGNSFDILQLVVADVFYRKDSVYHAISTPQLFLISLTLIMTAVLLLGLLVREKRGVGFESILILGIYLGGMFALVLVF